MASLLETRQMVTDQMDQDRQKRNDWRRLTRKLSYASRHGKGTDAINATKELIVARHAMENAGYNSSGISRFSQNRAKAIEEIRQSMALSEERRKALQPMQDAGLMPPQGQQPALIPTGIPGRYTPSSVVGALKEQGGAMAAAAEPEDTEPPVEEAPPLADQAPAQAPSLLAPKPWSIRYGGKLQTQLEDGRFVDSSFQTPGSLTPTPVAPRPVDPEREAALERARAKASSIWETMRAKMPSNEIDPMDPNEMAKVEAANTALRKTMTTAQFLQRKTQPGRFNILGAMSR